jgi:hypothetical protein
VVGLDRLRERIGDGGEVALGEVVLVAAPYDLLGAADERGVDRGGDDLAVGGQRRRLVPRDAGPAELVDGVLDRGEGGALALSSGAGVLFSMQSRTRLETRSVRTS